MNGKALEAIEQANNDLLENFDESVGAQTHSACRQMFQRLLFLVTMILKENGSSSKLTIKAFGIELKGLDVRDFFRLAGMVAVGYIIWKLHGGS